MNGMTAPATVPVCRHCGWFIRYEMPKAPAEPGWVHLPYRPDRPADDARPCDTPEPTP